MRDEDAGNKLSLEKLDKVVGGVAGSVPAGPQLAPNAADMLATG